MSKFSAFLKGNVKANDDIFEIKFDRFGEAFKIKALTEAEMRECRECAKDEDGKLIVDKFNDLTIIKSVVYPDLNDKDLLDSYGVMGAEKLLRVMFTSKEYMTLIKFVTKLNTADSTSLIEKAKN